MLKTVSVLACAVAAAHAADDRTVTANDVTATFMGKSGGMKLSTSDGAYLQLSQDKIQTCDADGKTVSGKGSASWNLAGGDAKWTELTETKVDGSTTAYTTTFTAEDGDKKFSLTAHLATTETVVVEAVPCEGCHKNGTNTMPYACERQNCVGPSNGTGNCVKQCVDMGSDGACPDKYTMCTNSVTVKSRELKFSFTLQGWAQVAGDYIKYGLKLKSNDNSSEVEVTNTTTESSGKIGNIGIVTTPLEGRVSAMDANDTVVPVKVTYGEQGGADTIEFIFPNLLEGQALYYDPSLEVNEAGGGGGGGGNDGTSGAAATTVCGLLSLVLALAMLA